MIDLVSILESLKLAMGGKAIEIDSQNLFFKASPVGGRGALVRTVYKRLGHSLE